MQHCCDAVSAFLEAVAYEKLSPPASGMPGEAPGDKSGVKICPLSLPHVSRPRWGSLI